MKNIYVNI